MIVKLTCPVCDRPQIEENICPNCETDLFLVRMLVELPSERRKIPVWLLFLVLIVGLGGGKIVLRNFFSF